MGRKRTGNGKGEMRGSLHFALCAPVGMTEWVGGAGVNGQRQEQRQRPIRGFWLRQNDDAGRVLRGGSWAVESAILRPSFRNWDHPFRRQIFSGVRLAWDVPDAGNPA